MSKKILVDTNWNSNFAYVIGLITTDGSLSKDGRHIVFTSKDIELVNNFQKSLKTNYKVKKKNSGSNQNKIYNYIQIGDVNFFKFLIGIGLMPNKSKKMKDLLIPKKYFFDFLRGHFDGDGSFYSYWDKRWRSSYMFYTCFVSASQSHILWLKEQVNRYLHISGHITKAAKSSCYQLKYAKAESLVLLRKIYRNKQSFRLTRKYLKIIERLAIIGIIL